MNIKEYISSGIIESYVMGLTTPEETTEFEKLCTEYPELVAARNQFEMQLEKNAFANAVTPPSSLKQAVLSAIENNTTAETVTDIKETPVRTLNIFKWAAAASVIFLIGTAIFAYSLFTKNKKLEAALTSTRTEQAQLDKRVKALEDEHDMMMKTTDPAVTVVSLNAMTPAKAMANIYWDTTSANVYMVIKNMPQLPTDKQYQLWALIDGQPKDLGLFDGGKEKMILKMNNTQKADAFAITIEQRGNGSTPHGEIQSMGKL